MPILLTSLTQKPIDKLLDPPSPLVDKSVLTNYITYKSPKWDDIVKPQLERRNAQIAETIRLEQEARQKAIEAARIAKQAQEVQTPPPAVSVAYAGSHADWLNAAGIPESEWANVDFIVSRESGWNPSAVNKSSGACSLMQALPCSKIPGNWNNPVDALKWGNSYVVSRYGSWAGAVAFWQTHHWC